MSSGSGAGSYPVQECQEHVRRVLQKRLTCQQGADLPRGLLRVAVSHGNHPLFQQVQFRRQEAAIRPSRGGGVLDHDRQVEDVSHVQVRRSVECLFHHDFRRCFHQNRWLSRQVIAWSNSDSQSFTEPCLQSGIAVSGYPGIPEIRCGHLIPGQVMPVHEADHRFQRQFGEKQPKMPDPHAGLLLALENGQKSMLVNWNLPAFVDGIEDQKVQAFCIPAVQCHVVHLHCHLQCNTATGRWQRRGERIP